MFQIWDLADPDGKGFLDKQVWKTSLLIQCFDNFLNLFCPKGPLESTKYRKFLVVTLIIGRIVCFFDIRFRKIVSRIEIYQVSHWEIEFVVKLRSVYALSLDAYDKRHSTGMEE